MKATDLLSAVKRAQMNPPAQQEVQQEALQPMQQIPERAVGPQLNLQPDDRQTRFLSRDMAQMLNEQIAFEMFSGYLYMMLAAWSQSKGLTGFEKHFNTQAAGEFQHAQRIYVHLSETGTVCTLPGIPSPTELVKFTNIAEACRAVLDHEMVVTRRWQNIGELAKREPNLATQDLSVWFAKEQVEEENTSLTILQRVLLADTGAGLLLVDSMLSK